MPSKLTHDDIVQAVTNHWLTTHEDSSVKVIASKTGFSPTTVRKVLNEMLEKGDRRIVFSTGYVPKCESNYRSYIGDAKCEVYGPSRTYLADLYKKAKDVGQEVLAFLEANKGHARADELAELLRKT